ncbi:MAG: DUF3738 domain-containing protein [Terracidiphilus sp.]|nr:DUF3738 domain-containing protein [Terracidiphilus sp.]MDR3797546.1 DUF3738 domain-containing protein [Terracidiphilus sp.]
MHPEQSCVTGFYQRNARRGVGSRAGLFTAIREQLGLKLDAAHIPTDVFVIDAATRPTQN